MSDAKKKKKKEWDPKRLKELQKLEKELHRQPVPGLEFTVPDASRVEKLPPEIGEAILGLEKGVDKVELLVRRLQGAPWAEILQGCSSLESARLHLMIAYTVNTLYYILLKTHGVSAAQHPVKGELERVKNYIRKLKWAEQNAQAGASSSGGGGASSSSDAAAGASERDPEQAALNVSAAQRFIAAALRGDKFDYPKGIPADPTDDSSCVGKTKEEAWRDSDGLHVTPGYQRKFTHPDVRGELARKAYGLDKKGGSASKPTASACEPDDDDREEEERAKLGTIHGRDYIEARDRMRAADAANRAAEAAKQPRRLRRGLKKLRKIVETAEARARGEAVGEAHKDEGVAVETARYLLEHAEKEGLGLEKMVSDAVGDDPATDEESTDSEDEWYKFSETLAAKHNKGKGKASERGKRTAQPAAAGSSAGDAASSSAPTSKKHRAAKK